MRVLSGKKHCSLNIEQFRTQINAYHTVHVDVGTGCGRFILNSAKKDNRTFYIGIDLCAENMYESATKAVKVMKKQSRGNIMFVVSSIENPPYELVGIADSITVILPWGSLRDGLVKGVHGVINNLRLLGKDGSSLQIIIGYSNDRESYEIYTHSLPVLSMEYLESLKQLYYEKRILINNIKVIGNNDLKMIDSGWAKRLAYGVKREIFCLDCIYI